MSSGNVHPLSEDMSLISDAVSNDFEPIQKDGKLFKFILYTTKVEIKFNSLIRLIFNTSIFEMAMWVLGFLLFIASPKDMYLVWFLLVHIIKGVLGLKLLYNMPRTYEIMENVAKNPNFQEDIIIELIQKQINEVFIQKWEDNKNKFFGYMVSTIVCVIIDFIIFIAQVAGFGRDEWILMQTCILTIIVVFIVSDVIYFLWFITLKFTFPEEILQPIQKAIFGSVSGLKTYAMNYVRRGNDNQNNNNQ
jgi:hypothetical protein